MLQPPSRPTCRSGKGDTGMRENKGTRGISGSESVRNGTVVGGTGIVEVLEYLGFVTRAASGWKRASVYPTCSYEVCGVWYVVCGVRCVVCAMRQGVQ